MKMKAMVHSVAMDGRRNRGFTLIELMVAVAIIAILTGIAVPIYNDQARKARRATGKADMLEQVQALERFNTVNGTFVGFPAAAVNSPKDGNVSYTIAPEDLGVSTYTLVATPQNDQVNDRCGELSLNQAGERFEGGDDTDVEDCW
jgi:type IV pilus assembly protein PilE